MILKSAFLTFLYFIKIVFWEIIDENIFDSISGRTDLYNWNQGIVDFDSIGGATSAVLHWSRVVNGWALDLI